MEQVQTRPIGAAEAYGRMAPLYDVFTAHHDYELWLGHLLPACRRAGLSGRRVLDVGCGTGKSFMPLLEAGWEVTGCDLAPEMLEIASHKATGRAELLEADAAELPVLGRFDLVMAIDDVVNYLLTAEALEAFFRGARRNLAPGGVLLFDANTLATYRTFFAETTAASGADGTELRSRGLTSADAPPGVLAEISFEARASDGRPLMEPVPHAQRHHPPDELIAALESAGLRSAALYGHNEDAVLQMPLDDFEHAKAIHIATARREGR